MFPWGWGGVWDIWDDPACLASGTSPGASWMWILDHPVGVEEEQPPRSVQPAQINPLIQLYFTSLSKLLSFCVPPLCVMDCQDLGFSLPEPLA